MRPVLPLTRLCVAALALATVLLGTVETPAQNRPATVRKVTARGTEKRAKRQPGRRVSKRPTKRALLVLLENDGVAFVLTQLKGMKGVELPRLPYMCYQGKGGKLELKLRKNESVVSAIARLSATIRSHATKCAGKKPRAPKPPRVPYFRSPPAPPKTPNPAAPSYVRALRRYTTALAKYNVDLAGYKARVARNLADFLDPRSWRINKMTTTEAVNVVRDFLLEEMTKGIQLAQNTRGAYDKVVVLEDKQVRADVVLRKIRELAPIYTLDIHVLTHGGSNKICGYTEGRRRNDLHRDNFCNPLIAEVRSGKCPLALRAVYQMNCSSGTLKDEWTAVGAKVVNGTHEADLNYLPHQYFHFMDRWIRRKQTFSQSSLGAHRDVKDSSEFVYKIFLAEAKKLVANSRLTVVGDGRLRQTSI